MKKFLSLITLFLIINIAFAQLQTGFHYKIKSHKVFYTKSKECYFKRFFKTYCPPTIYYTIDSGKAESVKGKSAKIDRAKADSNKVDGNNFAVKKTIFPKTLCDPKKGLKAGVLQDEKDPSILKLEFWAINSSDTTCQKDTNIINSSVLLDERHYYYLKIDKRAKMSDITKYISLPYRTWELGIATVPFKYRFGNPNDSTPNDASLDVSAGLYIGRKWGRTRYYVDKLKTTNSIAGTIALFVGPTVIPLSSKNTDRKVKIESNEMGIDIGCGFLLSYRDINAGIMGGFDIPVSGDSYKWIYANKPWIGFGIGYKLGIFNAGK